MALYKKGLLQLINCIYVGSLRVDIVTSSGKRAPAAKPSQTAVPTSG